MSTRTLPGGTRRWLTTAALAALLVTTTTACYGTWGIRESYRGYAGAPFAQGGITTESGATWLDGPGWAKGAFQWTVARAGLGVERAVVLHRGGWIGWRGVLAVACAGRWMPPASAKAGDP